VKAGQYKNYAVTELDIENVIYRTQLHAEVSDGRTSRDCVQITITHILKTSTVEPGYNEAGL
jgi:hypothetical protein